jgi:hypothetical protein
VGIWELDRVSLRSMASGRGRPVHGPHPRDIRCHTPTPAAPGAHGAVYSESYEFVEVAAIALRD